MNATGAYRGGGGDGGEDAIDALEAQALELLHALLERPAAAREAALREAAGDDAALLARVTALLGHVEDAELSGEGSAEGALPADLRFGPYRATQRIGRGGMGEVFRAERADGSYRREVAIKRIWGGSALLAERFLRERALLARLQHPNIAQLLDGGVDQNGHPWLAMELVRGENLHLWCETRQASLETRVRLVVQLCRALAHAHRHLIVHRDIKPGNILVDEDGHAKLLDFGIAKLLDEDGGEPTQTMTLAWSAPEQRDGRPTTTASDLYQLGQVLRHLLCGSPPQPQAPRMSREIAELRRRDPTQAAALARTRGLGAQAWEQRLRGDLDAIVGLATAADPAHRYPSADAFGEDLERWLDRTPVGARADERGYRLRRTLRRFWPALAGAALGLGFLGYHLERVSAERASALGARDLAEQQRRLAERQRDKANLTADYFAELFEAQTPSALAREQISARRLLDGGYRRLKADRDLPHDVRAHLLIATAQAYGTISGHDAQSRILRDLVADLERRADADPDAMADAYRALALAQNAQGDYAGADATVRKGLALFAAGKTIEPDAKLSLLNVRAMLLERTQDRAAARRAYRAVLAESERIEGRPGAARIRVGALTNLAKISEDPAEAEAGLREALALSARADPHHREVRLIIGNYLAAALSRQREYADAERTIERTLEQARAHYVGDEPWLGIILITAGKIDLVRGRHARGAQRTQEAFALLRRALGPSNPIVLQAAEDALLGALLHDDADAAARLHAHLDAADGAAGAAFRLAGAYLPCRSRPSPERIAAVAAMAKAIAKPGRTHKPVIETVDWAARCAARGAGAGTGAGAAVTESAPNPRRTR